MITPSDLIETLRSLDIVVEPRRLTDWRSKGLLPRLVERGEGRAQGKVYFWKEPEIVEQVILLEDLLWERSRSRFAALHLWRMGFPVSIDPVKEGWLFQLSRHQAAIDTEAAKYPHWSDLFGVMATFRGAPPDAQLDKSVQIALGAKLLELLFSPVRTLIDGDDARIALQFIERHVAGLVLELTEREVRNRTRELADFARNLISRPLLLKAVEEATADQLQVISRVLVQFRAWCSSFVETGWSHGINACLQGNRAIGLAGSLLAGLLVRIDDIDDLESAATFLTCFLQFTLAVRDDRNAYEKDKLRADFYSQTVEERRRIALLLKRLGYPEWGGAVGDAQYP